MGLEFVSLADTYAFEHLSMLREILEAMTGIK